MTNDDIITLNLYLIHEGEKAICVCEDEDGEVSGETVWLPLSMIEWDLLSEESQVIEVHIPEWLADQKGLT